MESVFDRIEQIAQYYNLSLLALSKKLNLKNAQIFYDMRSGKVQGISRNLLDSFKSYLPDVSVSWLLTGEGEMIIQTKREPYNSSMEICRLIKIIEEQNHTIALLAEQITKMK